MNKEDNWLELAAQPGETSAFCKMLMVACLLIIKDGQISLGIKAAMKSWAPPAVKMQQVLSPDFDLIGEIVKAAASGESNQLLMIELGKQLRLELKTGIKQDRSIPSKATELMKVCATYMINQGEPALRKIEKLVLLLNEPALTQDFTQEAKSQKAFVKPLEKIVQLVAKRKGTTLSTEEKIKLKAKNPEVLKEYMRLRAEFTKSWKDTLRNYVVKSKETTVDYEKAVAYLNSQGLEHTLPNGFKGKIDAGGSIYTVAGKKISQMAGPGFSIQMNPNYDPKLDNGYVFFTVNDETGKRSNSIFTDDYKKGASAKKFAKVANLMQVVEDIRKKWQPWLKKGLTTPKLPQVESAAVLELLYEFSARIGGAGNATAGQSTYGICTLLVKHIQITQGKITIKYPGKKGVVQKHVLTPASQPAKLITHILTQLTLDKKPTDRLFLYEYNGKTRPLTPAMVNKWFQSMGAPEGVTVHKLRHVKGTLMFNQLVAENHEKLFDPKKPLKEADALKVFDLITKQIGEALGHVKGVGTQQQVTGGTAIANYIDPAVMASFFSELNLRPPQSVEKAMKVSGSID